MAAEEARGRCIRVCNLDVSCDHARTDLRSEHRRTKVLLQWYYKSNSDVRITLVRRVSVIVFDPSSDRKRETTVGSSARDDPTDDTVLGGGFSPRMLALPLQCHCTRNRFDA